MDIQILEHYLDRITHQKCIVSPTFEYANGISMLLHDASLGQASAFFVGSLSVWRNVVKQGEVRDGATYLICHDPAQPDYKLPGNLNANVFLLNTSMDRLLYKLDMGISKGFAITQQPSGQACREFMEDLKNGYLANYDMAWKSFSSLPYPVKPHIGCVIIHSENDTLTLHDKDGIEQAIAAFFPDTNFFFYEKEWIVFFTQDEETTDILNFSYEDFSFMLRAHNLYAALSYPCQRPELMYYIYRTTSLALAVAMRAAYKPKISRVYPYKEINTLFLVHLSSQRFKQRLGTNNTMYLAHPDAVKIYYHDLEKNDNLLEILTVYLTTAQSITESSRILFMHRNTVYNKLKKIKELIHLDLDNGYDCCLLLLSCTVLKYQQNSEKMGLTDFL